MQERDRLNSYRSFDPNCYIWITLILASYLLDVSNFLKKMSSMKYIKSSINLMLVLKIQFDKVYLNFIRKSIMKTVFYYTEIQYIAAFVSNNFKD